jgi:endonuclease YncB( thermonuclease family)
LRLLACAISLLLLSAAPPQTVESFEGKVVALADGDTITVLRDRTQVKIRLEGIDAPEKNQAFGNKAKAALSVHVFRKLVTVNATGTDRYGRTLARVIIDGQDVSALMVREGFAWHYKEYSDDEDLAKLEEQARADKVGLWSEENALPPWEFRKRRKIDDAPPEGFVADKPSRAAESPAATATHWLNTSSNVRHNAGCQYFKNTKRGRACGPDDGKACGTCGG